MANRQPKLTVIEIFVVAVLVAALVSVGVWWYSRERSFDHIEVLKEDLRNLAAAQAAYSADNAGVYLPANSRVTTRLPYYGYAPSDQVVVSIAEARPEGWSATAVHELIPGRICGIYVGPTRPAPPNPATEPGEPRCE